MAAVAQLSLPHLQSPHSPERPPSSSPKSRNSFLSVSENPRSSVVSTSAASYLTAQTAQAEPSTLTTHIPPIVRLTTPESPLMQPTHVLAPSQANSDKTAPIHTHGNRPNSLSTRIPHIKNGVQLPNGYEPPPSPPSSDSLTEEGATAPAVLSGNGVVDTRRITPAPLPTRSRANSISEPRRKQVLDVSAGLLLVPSSTTPATPTRRYTTGSPFLGHRISRSLGGIADDLPPQLDSDILKEAEQIRRERTSKRAKAQAEAEAALTAPKKPAAEDDANKVLVGNLIGEDHVNYVLMYNMLTGIRIGVSRCQAKIKRPLTPDDYTARHKFSFDIVGNELTPSARYDFKFKDYAPWVFRELREEHFHLDPADYLLSLTSKYILSELGSPGKSGSFFYFSRDYRFIIKTIHHNEHTFLRKILPEYHHHVKTNPHTLLSRFYGLHRVKLPRGRKIHFVIMNNLFPPHRDIHETYDLKGSTVGREYPEEKASKNPRAVLKDLNWINRGRQLEFGPEKRAYLIEQLRRDSEFLKKINVMDYSLLVGIHNMQRGNRDNLRRNTLKVFQPDIQHGLRRRKVSQSGKADSSEAIAMRRAMRSSDPRAIGNDSTALPEIDSEDRRHFIFYQDEGGYRATDEANEPVDTIYYLGVIDICTPYTAFKKLEHLWKGLKADRHKISPVPAAEYASRFLSFLTAVARGGGGAQRFKPE